MKTSRPIYIIMYMLMMLPVLSSCRKDLCYDHFPKASLRLSYEQEWERDYGMRHESDWSCSFYGFNYSDMRPGIPEWVNLVEYNSDNNNNVADEYFLSPDGDDIILTKYSGLSFLFYNGDTEYIVVSDIASLPDAKASATSRSRAGISYIMERHPGIRSTNPPDFLYAAFIEEVPQMGPHEVKLIPVKMQPLVYTYLIRYEFEAGQEHIALARGALGGMAESVYLRDGRTLDESTIILYDCDVKDYGCEARVKSFGIPGFPDEYYGRSTGISQDRPYTLNLEVKLKNGKTLEYNFDIADQMKNQPRGGIIRVSGLKIEEEQAEPDPIDSGFDTDITEWDDHDIIDLPVNTTIPD